MNSNTKQLAEQTNNALLRHYESLSAQEQKFMAKCNSLCSGEDYYVCQHFYCPQEYFEGKYKIMVVGKEANGWDNRGNTEQSMALTKEFLLGSAYRSPFWNFAHEFECALNGPKDFNQNHVFYSNIFRISNNGNPKQLVSYHFLDLMWEYLDTLQTVKSEVQIVRPDVVLFLTGPYYDGALQYIFGDLETKQALPGYTERKISRLVHPELPPHSYRLYHPDYALRHKELLWNNLINLLKEKIHNNQFFS